MAFSLTKPIVILTALEAIQLDRTLHLLGFDRFNRENGGRLDDVAAIREKLRECGEAWTLSVSGHRLGDSAEVTQSGWVTTREAAEALGITVRGVVRAVEAGHLEGRRFGQRSWQIEVTSIAAYNEQRQARKGA